MNKYIYFGIFLTYVQTVYSEYQNGFKIEPVLGEAGGNVEGEQGEVSIVMMCCMSIATVRPSK